MADIANRYSENVPGKFYVDDQCIDCDLCRETAPANFTRTTGVIPTFSSNPPRRRKKTSAARRWKDARSKRSGTTAKAERDRTMTMNCPAKPTQRTVEPEAPTRA
jgi:ferredoxin